MKTSTNNYDFSLSKAPWLQLCRGIRSNQLYTFLKWYIQFFNFMFFFQTETLLLRAEKRGLCDCFHAIHWNEHWDLANGHLFILKMLFNKLLEDTECKSCHTTRKTIFIQTGTAQIIFALMCFISTVCNIASAEMSTEETAPKSRSWVLCEDSISLFWYFKPKIVPGLSGQPLSTCELP